MRNIFFGILSCCLISVVSFSACKRDKCKKVTCDHGQCVDGECICEDGYEGSTCNTPANAKFGNGTTYDLTETCTAGSDDYQVWVAAQSGTAGTIRIAGLWEQSGDTITGAMAAGGESFTIAKQAIGQYEIQGSGTTDGFALNVTITYKVFESGAGNAFDYCTATLVKP